MSSRSQWKMLHLLYTLPPSAQEGLSYQELYEVGIDCGPDTFQPLLQAGAVVQQNDRFVLSHMASAMLTQFVVANRRWTGRDIWVDYPKVFVIMPFSQNWSDRVYEELIKPAVDGAGLECVRGDHSVRIGDLAQDIWNEILQAGMLVADVSALNSNVFYEIGLAHSLGKEVFILKQKDAKVPADFGGAHYYEYELDDLKAGCSLLREELDKFSKEQFFTQVKSLRNRK